MRPRIPRALALLAFLALPLFAGGGARTARAIATITDSELRAHVEFLASDELEGRGTGSPGFDAAARYVATRIESWGLKPMGDAGSWYQEFKAGRGKNQKATQNVCGLVEGTDPALKGEFVIVGAHLDHVGTGQIMGAMGPKGEIHNGADDNASGSAAILELAEAFARFPPRRSILFLWFAGEEMGLLGSQHYVKNPTIALEKAVAMINLDMVGRSKDGYLFVGGVGTSPDLRKMVESSNTDGFQIEWGEGGNAPSDNSSFYRKAMPVLFFFTNVHEDYHKPGDDADKVNYEGATRIGRMVFQVAEEIADRDERLVFTKNDGFALPASMRRNLFGGDEPPRPPRNRAFLGVTPAEEPAVAGFHVGEVIPDSAAQAAGLKTGDVIVRFNDRVIEKPEDLYAALDAAKPGDEVTLRLLRDNAEVTVQATLKRAPRSE